MATPDRDAGHTVADWRVALWPALSLLGLVLPLAFLPQTEDYLYYFRVGELLPAYGTAWLFLAALVTPLCLLVLTARALMSRGRATRARYWLDRILIGAAAASAAAALLYCLLMWLQSFGWLRGWSLAQQLLWPALIAGLAVAATRRGQALAATLRRWALRATLVGACAALAVPFWGWSRPAREPSHPAASSRALDAAVDSAAHGPPHIVLLTIDALSAEHMSLYGATRATTPMIGTFASAATTFDRAYANANFTTPGVASILTGTRPWTHRALQLPTWPDADARRVSLPALLQRAGYQTAYVSTNPVAGADKNGLGRYFNFASRDRIHDPGLCTDTLSVWFKYACPIAAMPLFTQLVTLADRLHGSRDATHYDPQLAIEPALLWLERADKSRPVFLWVHLFPPHSPYAAPPPWLGAFDASENARRLRDTEPHWGYELGHVADLRVQVLAARYDESVAYADYYSGVFLRQALQLLGGNTVVVVTADHGESFRHGYGAHTGPGLYDEIIHVPLIIKLPGQNQGLHSPMLAEQVDIAPTLAQLAGLTAPSLWEGRSLLSAWSTSPAAPPPAEKPAYSMNFEQNPRFADLSNGVVAVIAGHWKLVHYLGRLHYPQMPPSQDALFDLALDPAETVNLAATQTDIVLQLRSLIDAQLAQHGGVIARSGTRLLDPASITGRAIDGHDGGFGEEVEFRGTRPGVGAHRAPYDQVAGLQLRQH